MLYLEKHGRKTTKSAHISTSSEFVRIRMLAPMPPPLPPVLPHEGFILFDRHVEKNGGTTFRRILESAQLDGRCMYWGYTQASSAWRAWIEALHLLNASSTPPRLCLEAHAGIDWGKLPWLHRFNQLLTLRDRFRERSVPLRVVSHLRIREPLSMYMSFYVWGVVGRQVEDKTTPFRKGGRRRHDRWNMGHTFLDWARATPNLQSEILLDSNAALVAQFAPLECKKREQWLGSWMPNASELAAAGVAAGQSDLRVRSSRSANSVNMTNNITDHPNRPNLALSLHSARARLALDTLRSFDLVGTTDRFDESALLVSRALGWSVNYTAHAPLDNPGCFVPNLQKVPGGDKMWWCRETKDKTPPDVFKAQILQRVCPDMDLCRRLIEEIAPVDHALYREATTPPYPPP